MNNNLHKVALVTGAARRIGRQIAIDLHAQNIDIAIHYRYSEQEAMSLSQELNRKRNNSAHLFPADLSEQSASQLLLHEILAHFSRLDFLVNNASIFYPTPILQTNAEQFDQFMAVNSRQAADLIREATPYLKQNFGSIVNIIDIYASRGLANHTAYVASKSALKALTHQFAQQLAPEIRVNGVSPGAILWPKQDLNKVNKQSEILQNSALKKVGRAANISEAVKFLLLDASYTTGAVIKVDGGRSLYI